MESDPGPSQRRLGERGPRGGDAGAEPLRPRASSVLWVLPVLWALRVREAHRRWSAEAPCPRPQPRTLGSLWELSSLHPEARPEPPPPDGGQAGIGARAACWGSCPRLARPRVWMARARRTALHGGRKTSEGLAAGKRPGRRLQDVALGVLMQRWPFRSLRAKQMRCTSRSALPSLRQPELWKAWGFQEAFLGCFLSLDKNSESGEGGKAPMERASALLQEILAVNCKTLKASGFPLCKVAMVNHSHLGGVSKTVSLRPRTRCLAHVGFSRVLHFLWLCQWVGAEGCFSCLPLLEWPLQLWAAVPVWPLQPARDGPQGRWAVKSLPRSLLPGLLASQRDLATSNRWILPCPCPLRERGGQSSSRRGGKGFLVPSSDPTQVLLPSFCKMVELTVLTHLLWQENLF